MRRVLQWTAGGAALLAVALLSGPRARVAEAWTEPAVGADVEAYLRRTEAEVGDLRSGEAKSITWADSATRGRTRLALVYLHGFSADRHELEPVPSRVARALGANVYHARLAGHGRDARAMGEVTAEQWLGDVAEAMAVADRIGEQVVLMGTSTGATLALWAAGQEAWRERIVALLLVSPNFGLRDPAARLLLWPWGGAIARVIVGPERCFEPHSDLEARHWTTCYPTRALLPMAALAEHVWTMPLERVEAPALVLYSPEDRIVDVERTRAALERLGSAAKVLSPVESEDPAHHVLAGDILSPGTVEPVAEQMIEFVRAHVLMGAPR